MKLFVGFRLIALQKIVIYFLIFSIYVVVSGITFITYAQSQIILKYKKMFSGARKINGLNMIVRIGFDVVSNGTTY